MSEVEDNKFISGSEKINFEERLDAGGESVDQYRLRIGSQSGDREGENKVSERNFKGEKMEFEARITVEIEGTYSKASPEEGREAGVEGFRILLEKEDTGAKIEITDWLPIELQALILDEYLDFLRMGVTEEDLSLELEVKPKRPLFR